MSFLKQFLPKDMLIDFRERGREVERERNSDARETSISFLLYVP